MLSKDKREFEIKERMKMTWPAYSKIKENL